MFSFTYLHFLKIFADDTFHMHKEQNLELLLVKIYVVFFLLVFFLDPILL